MIRQPTLEEQAEGQDIVIGDYSGRWQHAGHEWPSIGDTVMIRGDADEREWDEFRRKMAAQKLAAEWQEWDEDEKADRCVLVGTDDPEQAGAMIGA